MDLLNENRSLIHTGKLLRQPDTGFEWNGWTELFVLLFDNYCELIVTFFTWISSLTWSTLSVVMTKPRSREGATKYTVYRRVCLSLLSMNGFA